MSKVTAPVEFFSDLNGNALENGQLFIGTANLDPETNPIAVYWDAALTRPAPQPIRTIGGMPSRAGTPASLYVSASSYSITIRDKRGRLVHYSPENTTFSTASFAESNGSSLIGFIQAGTGAVLRTAESKMREKVTPADFGAAGDGVSDDSAEFALLEAAFKGATVDLCGKQYAASAVPTSCNYFNGAFVVAGQTYPKPRVALAHPLDGVAVAVVEGKKEHFWPGPVGQPSDDVLIGVRVTSWRHSVCVGSSIQALRSYDEGVTWSEMRNVFADQTRDARGLVGGMVNATRFGVFFLLLDSAGAAQGTRFAYTGDDGVTWTTVSPGGTAFYPHGDFVFDDGGGVNVFGYAGSSPTSIYRARSTDNGATWTVTLTKSGDGTVTLPVEPAVVRLGAGKFAMFVRDDGGGDLFASTSADLATWTPWAPSGVANGTNPPAALVAWGSLWLYLSARRSTPIGGREDKILCVKYNPDDAYSSGGVLTRPELHIVVAAKSAMIGYLTIASLRDARYIGFFLDGETLTGSDHPMASRLVRLGGNAPIVAAPALLSTRRTQPPITHNPTFNHWTRGTSFLGIASTVAVADRWQVAGSGANLDVTQQLIPDVIRKNLPCASNYYLNLASAVDGSGRILMQRFPQRERIAPMLDRPVVCNLIVNGTLPGYFRARTVLSFGGGGSAAQIIDADCWQRTVVGDLTYLSAVLYTPNADGLTWGTDPYLQFTFISNDAGVANANIFAHWWDWGDSYIPLDPPDFDAERAVLDQYCQKFTFDQFDLIGRAGGDGTANTSTHLDFPRMVATPAVTGTDATKVRVGGTALASASYDLISPQGARMVGVLSAGTLASGASSETSVVSGGTWSYTADVRM